MAHCSSCMVDSCNPTSTGAATSTGGICSHSKTPLVVVAVRGMSFGKQRSRYSIIFFKRNIFFLVSTIKVQEDHSFREMLGQRRSCCWGCRSSAARCWASKSTWGGEVLGEREDLGQRGVGLGEPG